MAQKANETLKSFSAKLEELSKKAKSASEDVKAAWDLKDDAVQETITTVKGNVAAAEENLRLKEEENRGKLSSALLKARMTVDAKMQETIDRHDKKQLERYITNRVYHVMDCYDSATLMIAEAELSTLEAMAAVQEYVDRFGQEPEVDAEAEEAAE